jgi:hypothetical protein
VRVRLGELGGGSRHGVGSTGKDATPRYAASPSVNWRRTSLA